VTLHHVPAQATEIDNINVSHARELVQFKRCGRSKPQGPKLQRLIVLCLRAQVSTKSGVAYAVKPGELRRYNLSHLVHVAYSVPKNIGLAYAVEVGTDASVCKVRYR
jgi:hypothetical protein